MVEDLKEVVGKLKNIFPSSIYPLIVVVTNDQNRKFFLNLSVDEVVSGFDHVKEILKEHQEICQIPQNFYLDLLVKIIKHRDIQLFNHMRNVRKYSLILAQLCVEEGLLPREMLGKIGLAAFLHDIGKLLIPDAILRKSGKLTEEEFEEIKKHTTLGAEIFQDLVRSNFAGELIFTTYEVIKYHHERWDGKGYPSNMVKDQIPIAARIVAIADVFDALTCDRYYRPAYSFEKAVKIMKEDQGHFDPKIFSIFLKNIEFFK
ncbi:HD-GYP domain-containing protein [Pseudothermotoga thermarum]|uniref:HD-GYP domain-containing protein n=1 Tax=Pseudothermotoga thermarum TaxID=119394 RepID=UPI0012FE7B3D|nr:HD domain-containing phosphohydrolase [Pseudothermotoga thermarum]